MKKIIIKTSIIALSFAPIISFAQQKDLKYLVDLVITYLGYGVFVILSLAVIMFVWNVYKYFIAGGDEANKAEAGMYVLWSVIAFFIILSFWGLVNILRNTFKLDDNTPTTFFGIFKSSSSNSSNNNLYNSNIILNNSNNPSLNNSNNPSLNNSNNPSLNNSNNPSEDFDNGVKPTIYDSQHGF